MPLDSPQTEDRSAAEKPSPGPGILPGTPGTRVLDVAVIGAGAAGLMATIAAARAFQGRGLVAAFDGARTLGAKILVAGGGRCNVTHHAVDARDYAGSTTPAIRKVLRRFTVKDTVEFFASRGVELKREVTGKLFPTTDKARTVLNALLEAAREAGATIHHPARVDTIDRQDDGTFCVVIHPSPSEPDVMRTVIARRVVVATGGLSLPKSGSDGHGYSIVKSLGHTLTGAVFPALVPLLLPGEHAITKRSGLATPATLTVCSATGKRLKSFTGDCLLTHFGLSGPVVLDVSRWWTDAIRTDAGARLEANWLPDHSPADIDAQLQQSGPGTIFKFIRGLLPERLATMLCEQAGVAPDEKRGQLRKAVRRELAGLLTAYPLPVTGDRGYKFAEVTAGGVPLLEVNLSTMTSRSCPGLHLCGEICDVDGRIGGFNFQWAWASGHIAGTSAAESVAADAAVPTGEHG